MTHLVTIDIAAAAAAAASSVFVAGDRQEQRNVERMFTVAGNNVIRRLHTKLCL